MFNKNKDSLLHEDISIDEFLEILKKGNIRLKQVTVENHSLLDGVQLKNTTLPKNILVAFLIRENNVTLADGNTYLEKNDVLILLGKEEDLDKIKAQLKGLSRLVKIKYFFAGLLKTMKIFK